MKDLLILLGKRVHELRVAKKWSQEEFAAVAGLHRTYVGQVERGEKNLSFANLVKISTVLGVAPSSLLSALDGQGAPHPGTTRKQESSPSAATASTLHLHGIQKLITQLTQQQKAMDHTLASLQTLVATNPQTIASPRARLNKRKPGRV